MKAVVIHGTGDIRYEEYPEPEIKPCCVKIRIMACGICGSDIPRVWKGSAHSYPIVLGHEFSGYVTEVGEGVTTLNAGDHVSGIPLIPCMHCPDCLSGNYSQCKHYSFIGSRQQGAMADYIVVPEQNTLKIDPSVSWRDAALFEPATVALHGIQLSQFTGGKSVLILGGGTIGCFTLQWAKLLGASSITVIGRDQNHLKVAQALGSDHIVSTLDSDYMQQLHAITSGHGFDYIYETAGSTAMMQLAFEEAANKSHVCFIGTPTADLIYTPRQWENLNRKELHLTGSWMSCSAPFPGNEWKMVQQFMGDGRLSVNSGMIFAEYPMEEAGEAFSLYQTAGKVKGRVVLYNRE
mgnify:FL=1